MAVIGLFRGLPPMLPRYGAPGPVKTPPSVAAFQYERPLMAGVIPIIGLAPCCCDGSPIASPKPATLPVAGEGGGVVAFVATGTGARWIDPHSTRAPESPVLFVVASGP